MDGFIDGWADGRRRRDGEENEVTKKNNKWVYCQKKKEIKKQRAK